MPFPQLPLVSCAAFLCLFIVAACSAEQAAPPADSQNPAASQHEDALPLPHRLALMTGHVEAGLALYRAGETAMAAPHLLHPVSETHAAERAGIDAYGFDGALFETVSAALKQGRAAADIEPQLQAAEQNLATVAAKAGGDPAEIIRFLMENVIEEYEIAITNGAVTDPGEYQDAYGFAIVARDRADALEGTVRQETLANLDALIALWPAAPIPPDEPASIEAVKMAALKTANALAS